MRVGWGVMLRSTYFFISPPPPLPGGAFLWFASLLDSISASDIFDTDKIKICLEDSTERSESNPGRSLGIINEE